MLNVCAGLDNEALHVLRDLQSESADYINQDIELFSQAQAAPDNDNLVDLQKETEEEDVVVQHAIRDLANSR